MVEPTTSKLAIAGMMLLKPEVLVVAGCITVGYGVYIGVSGWLKRKEWDLRRMLEDSRRKHQNDLDTLDHHHNEKIEVHKAKMTEIKMETQAFYEKKAELQKEIAALDGIQTESPALTLNQALRR